MIHINCEKLRKAPRQFLRRFFANNNPRLKLTSEQIRLLRAHFPTASLPRWKVGLRDLADLYVSFVKDLDALCQALQIDVLELEALLAQARPDHWAESMDQLVTDVYLASEGERHIQDLLCQATIRLGHNHWVSEEDLALRALKINDPGCPIEAMEFEEAYSFSAYERGLQRRLRHAIAMMDSAYR